MDQNCRDTAPRNVTFGLYWDDMKFTSTTGQTLQTDAVSAQRAEQLTARLQGSALRELAGLLPRLTGYRFVQIGRYGGLAGWMRETLCSEAGRTQFWLFDRVAGENVDARVEYARLPIASGSVDAVFLPHSLEEARLPQRLLREVDRILCPRGQLVILGLNPLSPRALVQRVRDLRRLPRRSSQWLAVQRISDWLGLLDYEVEEVRRYGGLQPRRLPDHWLARILAPLAPAYVVFARKRVIPITPVRHRQRAVLRIGPVALPEARIAGPVRTHLRIVK